MKIEIESRGHDKCKKKLLCDEVKFTLELTSSNNIFVGIDPDVHKSGIALWEARKKRLVLIDSLEFFEVYDLLKTYRTSIDLVRVEAGWLNAKSNFHNRAYQTKVAGERIAKNVGSNHEVGRKFIEMCYYIGLLVEAVAPLGKIDPNYFNSLTGLETKNQDKIDAVMLVYDLTMQHLKTLKNDHLGFTG